MTTLQYVTSESNQRGRKVILWRRGDYRYQIEVVKQGVTTRRDNIEAEYYDALDAFNQTVEGLDLAESYYGA